MKCNLASNDNKQQTTNTNVSQFAIYTDYKIIRLTICYDRKIKKKIIGDITEHN